MRYYISVSVLFFLSSCVFIRSDDSIDLGGKYRYIQDAPQTIVYHDSDKYQGGGKEIVPPKVISYAFNDRYIIAKSQEVDSVTGNPDGLPVWFWLIDKKRGGVKVEPLDSSDFFEMIKELKLSLTLK